LKKESQNMSINVPVLPLQFNFDQIASLALQLSTEEQKQLLDLLLLHLKTVKSQIAENKVEIENDIAKIQEDFAKNCTAQDLQDIDIYLSSVA
jgi:hypothetical protein